MDHDLLSGVDMRDKEGDLIQIKPYFSSPAIYFLMPWCWITYVAQSNQCDCQIQVISWHVIVIFCIYKVTNLHRLSFYSSCRVQSGQTTPRWGPLSHPWTDSPHTFVEKNGQFLFSQSSAEDVIHTWAVDWSQYLRYFTVTEELVHHDKTQYDLHYIVKVLALYNLKIIQIFAQITPAIHHFQTMLTLLMTHLNLSHCVRDILSL